MTTVAVGRGYEDVAADVLRAAGFQILWRNVRIGHLELDLVARRDDLVAIVEVRFRGKGAFDNGLSSITWRKRQRLLRAARGLWRGRLKDMPGVRRVRIDVIAMSADGVKWIEGAITE